MPIRTIPVTLPRNLEACRHIAQSDNSTLRIYDNVDLLFLQADTTEPADAPLDELIDWIQER